MYHYKTDNTILVLHPHKTLPYKIDNDALIHEWEDTVRESSVSFDQIAESLTSSFPLVNPPKTDKEFTKQCNQICNDFLNRIGIKNEKIFETWQSNPIYVLSNYYPKLDENIATDGLYSKETQDRFSEDMFRDIRCGNNK